MPEPTPRSTSFGRFAFEGVRLFACLLLALWILDTVVFVHPGKPGSVRNFAGMWVAHVQIACGSMIVALLCVGLVGIVRRQARPVEWIAPLLTMLLFLATLACLVFVWRSDPFVWTHFYWVAASACLLVWLVLRPLVVRFVRGNQSILGVTRLLLLPPLLLILAVQSMDRLGTGELSKFDVARVMLLVFLVVSILAARQWGRVLSPSQLIVPLVASILVPIVVCGRFARFGATQDTLGPNPEAKPHLVLIVLDTVRADHLQSYGYTRNTMPALERWAANAAVFERAVSPAGWTSPAHASMFSGEAVSVHGVHYSRDGFRTQAVDGIRWLPDLLSEQGYYGLAVSSNILAVLHEFRGFDRAVLPGMHDWKKQGIAGMLEEHYPSVFRFGEGTRWRLPYADAAQMAGMIQRAVPEGEGPLFLFTNFLDAHSPYHPPKSALDALGVKPSRVFHRNIVHRGLTMIWEKLPEEKRQSLVDLYDGELRSVDMELEGILDWIDRRLGPDCVVVVTSDHGEELGEEGRIGHEFGLAQAVIHVPLMVRAPWIEPGRHSEPVTLRNLYRFLAAIGAGQEPGPEELFANDEFDLVSERYYSSYNIDLLGKAYARSWVSLVDDGYKGVGPTESGFRLVDIASQGFDQEVEIADDAIATRLRNKIDRYWAQFRDDREPVEDSTTIDEEDLKRLRALGYIQ